MGKRRSTAQKKTLTAIKSKFTIDHSLKDNNVKEDVDVVVIDDDDPVVSETAKTSKSTDTNVKTDQGCGKILSPLVPQRNFFRQKEFSPVSADEDDFMLSQRTEHDFEVGWNPGSPLYTSNTRVDTTDLIRKHFSKKHVDRKMLGGNVTGSPGLSNLWSVSSPVSHHKRDDDSEGSRPHRVFRKNRVSTNIKNAANYQDLLRKLAAVSKSDVSEDTSTAAVVQVPTASTPVRRSARLTATDKDDIKKTAVVLFSSESDLEDAAKLSSPQNPSSKTSAITTPPSTRPAPKWMEMAETPKSGKADKSMEDLWTDDDFESDSFLAATQTMVSASVPSPVFDRSKRKTNNGDDSHTELKKKSPRYDDPVSTRSSTKPKPKPQWKIPNVPSVKEANTNSKVPFQNSVIAKSKSNNLSSTNSVAQSSAGTVKNPALNASNQTVSKPTVSSTSSWSVSSSKSTSKPSYGSSSKTFVQKPLINSSKNSCSNETTAKSSVVDQSKQPVLSSKANEFIEDNNTSISDDILAALAEPDDMLDSQACLFDDTMTEEKPDSQTLKDKDQQPRVEPPSMDSTMDTDEDSDLIPEDALLAVLEQAESQASQTASQTKPPPEVSTVNVPLHKAPVVDANLTISDASQFSVNSTFRPVMHSTQHIAPSVSSATNQFAKPQHMAPPLSSNTYQFAKPKPIATNKFSGPANGTSKPTSNKVMGSATASGYTSKFIGISSNSLNIQASDSVTSSQASYSRDQIERKRLEALQKRQNRLKLKAPK